MARMDRVKPTHYPVAPFHAIRSTQLVSSIIVASIISYFLRELSQDHSHHYRLPWTFLLLFSVSTFTILFLSATIILHCFYGLNPKLNIVLNSTLLVLWSVAFGLLSWWSSGTLTHVCNRRNWEDSTGISICRLYKALFSFSLFGLVGTIAALALDVKVQKDATRMGTFTALRLDDRGKNRGGLNEAYDEEGHNSERIKKRPTIAATGYELPEGQFAYDEDTEYVGAGGQVERRSLEHRI